MTEDHAATLHAVDEPGNWETPDGFDRRAADQGVQAFADALQRQLGPVFRLESGTLIQDASYHAALVFEGGELRFSSFGKLVAFTPDHSVSPNIVDAVSGMSLALGYTLVPTTLLEQPYRLASGSQPPGIRTWWIRFFDYL